MQQVNSQIRAFLKKGPTESELTDFINNFSPAIKPTLRFNQVDHKDLKEPTPVYIHLMVQDIRESYFYYSFIMKKTFTEETQFSLYKYGNDPKNFTQDLLENNENLKVMTDREPVICTPIRYQTKWVDQMEKRNNSLESIQLVVDGKAEFKLGEVIHAVAMYHPEHEKLYYIRSVGKEEVKTEKLDPLKAIFSEVFANPEDKRKHLLEYLHNFFSEKYCQFLLFSLISQEPLFISCNINIELLVKQIYPRVCHLQIKHPFKKSFFPFKNQEGQLILTPMQLSNQPTFVILDFSQFSTEKEVKIEQEEIDNLKALKVFAQQHQTIYRWEIGQSQIKHVHGGVIVRASSIVTPQFTLKEEKMNIAEELILELNEEKKSQFRHYLQYVRTIDPRLSEEERVKIEKELEKAQQKDINANLLAQRMQISKYIAQSRASPVITLADYQEAQALLKN